MNDLKHNDNRCEGIFGFLFGHKFNSKYMMREIGTIDIDYKNILDESTIPEILEASKLLDKTYVMDICERCGKIIKVH